MKSAFILQSITHCKCSIWCTLLLIPVTHFDKVFELSTSLDQAPCGVEMITFWFHSALVWVLSFFYFKMWCLILHLSCRRKLNKRILNLYLEINKKDSILKLALVMNDIICNKVHPYLDEKKVKHWQNELFYLVPLSI